VFGRLACRCCKPPGEKQAQPTGLTLAILERHLITFAGWDNSLRI
jgi:hypothetical protein